MLKSTIEAIIGEMPKGCIFDAHIVIQLLIEKNTEEYLQAYNQQATVESFHSCLSKEIDAFTQRANGELITRVGEAWSKNIRNNYSVCVCWKKK